jgi:four helix bundle protein
MKVLKQNHFKGRNYSLTDQIRRSSRNVPATIAEAYRKEVIKTFFIEVDRILMEKFK